MNKEGVALRILVAGPGTGKTSCIKSIIGDEFASASNILVLSFTNATVRDLAASFVDWPAVNCYTLHSYALKINHLTDFYVLDSSEEAPRLQTLATSLDVDFQFLCRQLRCITFDAMVSECLAFLRNNPAYAREKIGTLDLLVVDEYQDFNPAERELVDAISKYAADAIVLGDDDQSIYDFKDADPDGIIEFYNREDVDKLPCDNVCHRCPDVVVDAATHLIRRNRNRIAKPWLKTNRQGTCQARQFLSQGQTNDFIVSTIEEVRSEDPSATFLVLSPVGFYVEELRQLLDKRGVGYVDSWTSTITHEDYIRAWWLRAIFSERRLLNLLFLSHELTAHYRQKLRRLVGDALQTDFDQAALVKSIKHMYDDHFVSLLDAAPSFEEFAAAQPDFAGLVERIDRNDAERSLAGLLREMNPTKAFDPKLVNVMSIHKSKGLETDCVFISGLVDGVLPNNQRGIDTIEAQRRLLFVGVTRARRCLYLLSSVEWDGRFVNKVDKSQFQYAFQKKKYNGRTSTFIGEMFG
jgi:superfamily I DNA/RNA helicase